MSHSEIERTLTDHETQVLARLQQEMATALREAQLRTSFYQDACRLVTGGDESLMVDLRAGAVVRRTQKAE